MGLPFLYIAIGILMGITKNKWIIRIFEPLASVALGMLMFAIGANIGSNDKIISNIGSIGFYCAIVALSGTGLSIFLAVLSERTIMPLEKIRQKLLQQHLSIENQTIVEVAEEKPKSSLFLTGIPLYILIGVVVGYFFITEDRAWILDYIFTASLFFIYVGVGVGLGADLKVFQYIRLLGWRVLILSGAVIVGSLFGGYIGGLLVPFPLAVSMIASGGLGYYSLTTAYMTQTLGAEAGIYGFLINVIREFATILLLPVLIRLGKSAPIAGAASGSMDTMLLPVTRFVGQELGIVTLITGVVLTVIIPFLLPILFEIFQ